MTRPLVRNTGIPTVMRWAKVNMLTTYHPLHQLLISARYAQIARHRRVAEANQAL
jgi:hypothetical protein